MPDRRSSASNLIVSTGTATKIAIQNAGLPEMYVRHRVAQARELALGLAQSVSTSSQKLRNAMT